MTGANERKIEREMLKQRKLGKLGQVESCRGRWRPNK
jgi:hypothetical protein